MSQLSIRNLTKRYGDFVAVDGLDLEVPKGEMVAFLGPSGCGKTTSLRMVAGLVPATSGQVVIGGRDLTRVPTHQRDIGLVFQNYALFPHMTVAANVAFGLEMRQVERHERDRRVTEALRMVHLEGMEKRKPSQLSGGQQQRVALARALVIKPSILLFDEPLSNLDAKLRDEMRNEIRDIQRRLCITAIFVTHDQGEALAMCDKVVVLNRGRIEQLGTPEDLYERPATPFVASFIGRGSWFEGTARGQRMDVPWGAVATERGHHGAARLMVRPHRLRIARCTPSSNMQTSSCDGTLNRVMGTVERIVYTGDVVQYDVRLANCPSSRTMAVEQSTTGQHEPLAPGMNVAVSFEAKDALVFGGAA